MPDRREGPSVGDVLDRLGLIERRLSRIEGGLILAAFLVASIMVPTLAVIIDHIH